MASFKFVQKGQVIYKDGTYPIFLRITHNRKVNYKSINYKCTIEQWNNDKCRFRRNFPKYKEKNIFLDALMQKCIAIRDKMSLSNKPFTYADFLKEFSLDRKQGISVFTFWDNIMEQQKNTGKIGNRNVYKQAQNSLHSFCQNENLVFTDIDYKFLKNYETYLFKRGCTNGGVNNYMRTLRAIVNEAIRQGYFDKNLYPFSTNFNKNGYSLSKLKSSPRHIALSIEDLSKVKNFDVETYPHLKKAKFMFLFSYYTFGMNFADMARLKWQNIYNGRIIYKRVKTGKQYNLKVTNEIQSILHYFEDTHTDYIFPILSEFHQTEQQIKNRTKKKLGQLNKQLKEIATILGIRVQLTSYVARHTFATISKMKGVDISKISEALGHDNIETTKAYLKAFEPEDLDSIGEVL